MRTLGGCPCLSFLTLSLDGYQPCSSSSSGSGVDEDLWDGLPRLMAALGHVVCLDVSECRMQDCNLQVNINR